VAVAAEVGAPVETEGAADDDAEGAADDVPEPQAANRSAAMIASGVRLPRMSTSAIIQRRERRAKGEVAPWPASPPPTDLATRSAMSLHL
jgi:hypothetical protein